MLNQLAYMAMMAVRREMTAAATVWSMPCAERVSERHSEDYSTIGVEIDASHHAK